MLVHSHLSVNVTFHFKKFLDSSYLKFERGQEGQEEFGKFVGRGIYLSLNETLSFLSLQGITINMPYRI